MQMKYQILSKTSLKKIKLERLRKQHLRNVELDPTLTHFIWNKLDNMQHQIIQCDCEDITKLIPKENMPLLL